MRARYSAFAVHDRDFLATTWHSSTKPDVLELDTGREWTGLQLLGHTGGGMLEATGTVEFCAHYRQEGKRGEQRENSRFVREDGQWRYLGTA
jgi:SEC-C motif-containing protein